MAEAKEGAVDPLVAVATKLLADIGVTKGTAAEAAWALAFAGTVKSDPDSYAPSTLHRARHLFLVKSGVEKHQHRGSWTADMNDEIREQFSKALENLKTALSK